MSKAACDRLAHEVEAFCASEDAPSFDDLGAELVELRRLINVLELPFARAAARLDSLPESRDDDGDAATWLRDHCRLTGHAARTAVHVGALAGELSDSTEALVDGRIGMAHLGWLVGTAWRLQHSDTATARVDEHALLPTAETLSVQRFRRACEDYLHRTDREAFTQDQADGVESRRMRLTTDADGAVHIDALLDAEGGAVVTAALEPWSRPSSAGDHRRLAQRRADALVEACSHLLDAAAVPQRAGNRPHLHVTTTLETLLAHVGAPAAECESGALLSGAAAQRLACDATIVRVLVNPRSQVVDVGRAARGGAAGDPPCPRSARSRLRLAGMRPHRVVDAGAPRRPLGRRRVHRPP